MARKQILFLLFYVFLAMTAIVFGVHAFITFQHTEVVVEWKTASEIDIAGYNLYRSDGPNGVFEKVNSSLIAPVGDMLAGGSYQYKDASANWGQTYYYELESVDNNGTTTRYNSIQVKATNYAWMELILALCLLAISITGIFLVWRNMLANRPSERLTV